MTTTADQPSSATTAAAYGVHSEVGKLRNVRARNADAHRVGGRRRQGPGVGAAGARARRRPVRDGDRRRRRLPRLGRPTQARIERATTSELASSSFAAGSMGPKVEAAVDFAERTGNRAAIGTLAEVGGLAAGTHGTSVVRG